MLLLNKTVALTLASSLCLAACAGRDDGRPKRPELTPERKAELYERFTVRWDFNGDGLVSCADVEFQREQLFTLLDTDTDDQLASGEYRYAKFEDKSFLFHLFTDVDTDSSGSISRVELNRVQHSQFASLDKDANCLVDEEEAAIAARERAREARGEGANREGRNGRGGGRPGGQRRNPGGGVTDTTAS